VKVLEIFSSFNYTGISENEKRKLVYEAAASEFLLPSWEQVEEFREGGPLPDLPTDVVKNTPFTGPAVGRMVLTQGEPYALIVTDGGREIVVEKDRVTIRFKTSSRDASAIAASNILKWLHTHSIDNVAFVRLEDGRAVPDGEISPEEIEEQ